MLESGFRWPRTRICSPLVMPPSETSGAVCLANKLARFSVVGDLIVYFRTRQTAGFCARTDRDRLHCRYRHHGLREQTVELEIPGGANPTRTTPRATTSKTPPRVSPFFRVSSMRSIIRCCASLSAQCKGASSSIAAIDPRSTRAACRECRRVDDVTANFDSEDCQQLFCECAARDARGSFAC